MAAEPWGGGCRISPSPSPQPPMMPMGGWLAGGVVAADPGDCNEEDYEGTFLRLSGKRNLRGSGGGQLRDVAGVEGHPQQLQGGPSCGEDVDKISDWPGPMMLPSWEVPLWRAAGQHAMAGPAWFGRATAAGGTAPPPHDGREKGGLDREAEFFPMRPHSSGINGSQRGGSSEVQRGSNRAATPGPRPHSAVDSVPYLVADPTEGGSGVGWGELSPSDSDLAAAAFWSGMVSAAAGRGGDSSGGGGWYGTAFRSVSASPGWDVAVGGGGALIGAALGCEAVAAGPAPLAAGAATAGRVFEPTMTEKLCRRCQVRGREGI